MRANFTFFAALFYFFAFAMFPSLAETPPENKGKTAEKSMTREEFKEAYEVLNKRIADLREAKRNAQTKSEKQRIRQEIFDVKKEAKQLKEQAGVSIYLGAGAIVLILLLLLFL